MSYTKTNVDAVEKRANAMQFMRDPLDCERLGFTVVDCDPGWTGKEHDHADEDHEEVYFLASGAASLVVDGERVDLSEGDAVRVSPDATRRIENGDVESRLIVVGAP